MTVFSASATNRPAPRGEPHDPLRSRWATTTGADWLVLTVASSALRPRTPGVAVAGALLRIAVDLDDRVVDVDQDPPTRSCRPDQRALVGQPDRESRRHGIEL